MKEEIRLERKKCRLLYNFDQQRGALVHKSPLEMFWVGQNGSALCPGCTQPLWTSLQGCGLARMQWQILSIQMQEVSATQNPHRKFPTKRRSEWHMSMVSILTQDSPGICSRQITLASSVTELKLEVNSFRSQSHVLSIVLYLPKAYTTVSMGSASCLAMLSMCTEKVKSYPRKLHILKMCQGARNETGLARAVGTKRNLSQLEGDMLKKNTPLCSLMSP